MKRKQMLAGALIAGLVSGGSLVAQLAQADDAAKPATEKHECKGQAKGEKHSCKGEKKDKNSCKNGCKGEKKDAAAPAK